MLWVAADCEFDKNTEIKIDNWNKVVEDDDEVLILGLFTNNKNFDFISKLKGSKRIIDYSNNLIYDSLTVEQLKEKGFIAVNLSYAFVRKNNCIVHIIPEEKGIERAKNSTLCAASARSITKQTNILENNILSLSYVDWDFTPIEYGKIPELFVNIKKYMEIPEEDANVG